jgi:hypothetical protein
VTNSIGTTKSNYSPAVINSQVYEDEMQPYMSLFMKPLNNKKSGFSKQELEAMCKDPLHSPRLIRYIIDFVKDL